MFIVATSRHAMGCSILLAYDQNVQLGSGSSSINEYRLVLLSNVHVYVEDGLGTSPSEQIPHFSYMHQNRKKKLHGTCIGTGPISTVCVCTNPLTPNPIPNMSKISHGIPAL